MIQLRIKTEYSFGETYAPISRIIQRLTDIGCKAAAIVDIDGTWGHVPWCKACIAASIKPMLGVDLIVTDNNDLTRMWFIAKNSAGLKELYQFTSEAYHNKIKTKWGSLPRLTKRDVRKMSKNVLKFAGSVFDEDFLIEVGAYLDLNPSSISANFKKKKIANKSSLRLVETSDNNYAYPEDAKIFKVASRAGSKVTPQYILEKVDASDIATDEKIINIAPVLHVDGDLLDICRNGIKQRGLQWNDKYEERLQYELQLIESKNFASYFIIVADMVQFAKQHMLVGPSRGSAAGSLVCYAAQITEIDPIKANLFFERFIDVTRVDLPDIDLDFPDSKRHLVFEYMREKYGDTHVSHIGTLSLYKPRSCLIHACKELGYQPSILGNLTDNVITRTIEDPLVNQCLRDTLKTNAVGVKFAADYPLVAEVASAMEGLVSHTSVHAAGVLVCDDEISNYATVTDDGIAQIDKRSAEYLGLLKIDVLGLRTLSILEDSGVQADWYNLPLDDENVFDLYNNGKMTGIFQFEGAALRSISKDACFCSIDDVNALTAIARPGPMGSGVTEKFVKRMKGATYKPIHPLVEAIMKETYGLPLYQEHTIAIVRDIGNFSWEDTAYIRKAIAKSQGASIFTKMYPMFLKNAVEKGLTEEQALETWELINAMGGYQMNKAHTYSYAVLSYWTAWLKFYHPLEFLAASLKNSKDEESDKNLLREMVKDGVKYVPFDIKLSEESWCVKNEVLYGGFNALTGIGEVKARKYISARNNGELTNKHIEELKKCENPYANLFPIHAKYQALYDAPEQHGILGEIVDIESILQGIKTGEERVFIGELVTKFEKDLNDDYNLQKRGGKKAGGQTKFVDLSIRDDSGTIKCRIAAFNHLSIGKELFDTVPIGSHLLIRAKFFNNASFAFISKWRVL